MSERVYEIVSLAMRYWFVLLAALIVLRSFAWLLHDRGEKHRRLRSLPDAGFIGELLVLTGSDELPQDATVPVPWEGTLGFVRSNDMVVPVRGVAHTQLDCAFEEGVGLVVTPRFHRACTVDGEEIRTRADAKAHPMLHGSVLEVGEARLRLRVFIGIDAERKAAPEQPVTPQQTGYTAYLPQQMGYPAYPPQQMSYPAYPPEQTGYPAYPQQQTGYTAYPPQQQTGYPAYPPQTGAEARTPYAEDDPYLWAPPADPAALPEVTLPEPAAEAPARRRRRRVHGQTP